jgi:hypothetical protein
MAKSGRSITGLRAAWQKHFGGKVPFTFLAVAGERDQFVPPKSSIRPIPGDQQAVVSGNRTHQWRRCEPVRRAQDEGFRTAP